MNKFRFKNRRWLAVMIALLVLMVSVTAVFAETYTVQRGDTLFSIAQRFGTTVNALVAYNNLPNPNLIFAGQKIEIPEPGAPLPTAVPPSTTPAPPTNPTPAPPTQEGVYIVQPGDTLYRIAARYNTTIYILAEVNNLTNVNYIYVGQRLTIPGGTGSPPPTNPTNPTTPPVNPLPPITGSFELGGQSTGFHNAERMNYAGMSWVKIQHKWGPSDDPNALAGIINEAHNRGFKILLSVTGANTYPAQDSIDFTSFANFMGGVAALGPDALEVWNEMNIDFEWPAGQISPSSYVNSMLKPAYQAIKAANPNVMVITGALAPTGFDNTTNAWADNRYIAGMASAGAGSYADCIGVHHNAGATSPTVSSGHPAGTHYSWYFQPTMNLYYNAFGGSRKVCFTELGYVSPEGFPGISSNFSWGANNTVGQHAQWLAEAASVAANSGKVRMMIVFNVDFTNYDANGDPQAGYAMVRPDGSCPACETLHSVTGGR